MIFGRALPPGVPSGTHPHRFPLINRIGVARPLLRTAFKALQPKRSYEPLEIGGRKYPSKREAETRWTAIAAAIELFGARSILDIGCAEGWFLRRAAHEFGCFAIGVDGDERRVMLGEIARLHDGVDRVAVMKSKLQPDSIVQLPRCDIVLCLSVLHHVIRRAGLSAAEAFLGAVCSRAGKALLFEIGTSDEKELHWSGILPDMPGGQEEFVTGLLARCGMQNIRVVASTPGLRKDAARLLFAAEPHG
jgi:SAM-dependent methyltransferase